jgi:hypothetical protein
MLKGTAMKNLPLYHWTLLPVMVTSLSMIFGCRQRTEMSTMDAESGELIALLMPQSVKIQPFTKPKSFDKDAIPDGIEVLVQPLDKFNDPVKAVGAMQFELFRYQPASGQSKGERIQFWEVLIDSEDQIDQFWDRTAQMYLFKLAVDEIAGLPVGVKYVLTVRYNSPQGEHLEDEYVFNLAAPSQPLANSG